MANYDPLLKNLGPLEVQENMQRFREQEANGQPIEVWRLNSLELLVRVKYPNGSKMSHLIRPDGSVWFKDVHCEGPAPQTTSVAA